MVFVFLLSERDLSLTHHQLFNSRVCGAIVGGAAVQMAVLKSITGWIIPC